LAKKFLVDRKSPETLREFVNTLLARGAVGRRGADQRGPDGIDGPPRAYRAPVPFGAAILTCGVDVQADRIELELVGGGAAKNPGA
jgi:phage terminase large subunit GpA-like protein